MSTRSKATGSMMKELLYGGPDLRFASTVPSKSSIDGDQDLGHAEMLFFWRDTEDEEYREFSQWYSEPDGYFEFQGETFFCAEQAMMASKAKLFNDYEIRTEIMKEKRSPRRCKELGRKVKNFDQEKWGTKSLEIVTEISYAKFSQNERLKRLLLSSGDKTLAEASPYDKVWGIGLEASDPRAHNCNTWCGENKLGIALMNARQMIRSAKYTAQ